MMLNARVEALVALGFTERQARFVATVALHSGYCLRRQYATFTGQAYGKNVRDFLDRLVSRGLAVRLTLRADRGHLYHLRGKSLYRALSDEDNRNRRAVPPAQIARKLMLLDYVLSERAMEWLVTEDDKVAFFTQTVGIAHADLPRHIYHGARGTTTTRYFVEKLPVAVGGDPLTVRFVYLTTDTSGAGFEQFLWSHAHLMAALTRWTLVVICPRHVLGVDACVSRFQRWSAASTLRAGNVVDDDLRWYFRTRRLVDAEELQALSIRDLARYHDVRRRYATAHVDSLYAAWCRDGEKAVLATLPVANAPEQHCGQFLTEVLPHRYEQFGSLPGIC